MDPNDLAAHLDQGRYGMFWSDGTITPQPKPLVPALRFLRDYAETGGAGGELTLVQAENQTGTGYVFRAAHGLFVGNTRWSGPELQFTAAAPANMLVRWNEEAVTLVSTADATVRVKPMAFVARLKGPRYDGAHRHRNPQRGLAGDRAIGGGNAHAGAVTTPCVSQEIGPPVALGLPATAGPPDGPVECSGEVARRQIRGGLVNDYYRQAA